MEIFQDGELEEELRKSDLQAGSLSAIWTLFSSSYEEAVNSLTCPVRASYTLADLGHVDFSLDPAQDVHREDFQLYNCRGQALECSFWRKQGQPVDTSRTSAPPCIVYLHGMSSSRRECVYLRHKVLSAGFSLFAFDLSGSGLSEGEFISFGYYEKDDLRTVLDYLFATGKASAVGLWGRCIGGATILQHQQIALTYKYKTLRVPKFEAHRLQIEESKATGELLCVRPPRVFPFRVTSLSANNGDFVILSINRHLVKNLDVAACKRLLTTNCQDGVIEIAGYEQSNGVSNGVTCDFVFGLTVDSTYGDMQQVIADMLTEVGKSAEKRNISFTSAMMGAASRLISHSVKKTAGYQFKDIAVLDDVPLFRLPCLFVSARRKDFISPAHTRAIYDHYGGEKTWLDFGGVHDENRPNEIVDAICSHFCSRWKRV
ncbi:hypothetical protein Poli38472_004031 [Pythium oligandrum]|uniref:Serine aminopeptidase S33 domain-containing protein n=1 Tax=Pythium oligandrum TaxID=41045 RepID=A0A8K1CPB0_PYTOL|nr:hypothetical protein Poli38472_004031 [Pythium oligandrum]|eukprot:TMW66266.1 hypothetical protein Poli38472_004031 [Pythium oligandrum]